MKTNAAVCVQMAGMALIAGVSWKCTLLILFYVLTLSWILCIAPDIREHEDNNLQLFCPSDVIFQSDITSTCIWAL